jgi:hypothetical protein
VPSIFLVHAKHNLAVIPLFIMDYLERIFPLHKPACLHAFKFETSQPAIKKIK